jgi:hypothetical protein
MTTIKTMRNMSRLIDNVMNEGRSGSARSVQMEAEDAMPDLGSVDLKPLEDKLKSILGVKVDLTLSKRGTQRGDYVAVKSQDVRDGAGLFKNLMSEVFVSGTGEYSAKEGQIWLPIDVSWEFAHGGSNGHSVLTAWYEFATKKWMFRDR